MADEWSSEQESGGAATRPIRGARPLPQGPHSLGRASSALVAACADCTSVGGGQPAALDERADSAGASAGVAERGGVWLGRALGAPVDKLATVVLGAGGRYRQRLAAGLMAGRFAAGTDIGAANLRGTGTDSYAGLDSVVHAVLRHRRVVEARGTGKGRGGSRHLAHAGRCTRCPAQTA